MGKAEMKKSHDNLRAACKDMVCAVRENPSAFDGIRIPTNTNVFDTHDNKQVSAYSVGALGLVIAALIRVFH